jgi:SSS family solute:Na+ symporter
VFLFNVMISGIIWLTVTLLTRRPDPADLVSFYLRVRPGGFWGPVQRLAEGQAASPAEAAAGWRPRRRLESFLLTVVLVYGSLFGTGQLLYGRWTLGAVLLAVAGLAATRIAWNVRPSPAGDHHGATQPGRD